MGQNRNTWFYLGGSRLNRTDDFQKFSGSGLDQIQFFMIRIGLGLKNFTVCSSLPPSTIRVKRRCLTDCSFWIFFTLIVEWDKTSTESRRTALW